MSFTGGNQLPTRRPARSRLGVRDREHEPTGPGVPRPARPRLSVRDRERERDWEMLEFESGDQARDEVATV